MNDNSSIDHKVEDAYLGDELYMIIMDEFKQRLEARGRVNERIVCQIRFAQAADLTALVAIEEQSFSQKIK